MIRSAGSAESDGAKARVGSGVHPVAPALDGDDVVIARAGKPLVKLVTVDTSPRRRKLGFMRNQGIATADVKSDFADDINAMFNC